jgi:tetratricopeptide (TPR) repeat protein
MGIMDKLGSLLKKEESKDQDSVKRYLSVVKKEPDNATAHLKLAEIYQKKGEKKKAIAEYLMAAEIFLKNQFYARAMAIYKQVPKKDPSLDHVYLKIAEIYRKMGFLGDAFAQYRILVQHYDKMGMKDKALEVLSLMAEMDPRKADLKERIQIHQTNLSLGKEGIPRESGMPQVFPAELPGREKHEGFFDLGAELDSVEPAPMSDLKEISTMEKIYGFEEIFKELRETSGPSSVDPNFNYNLGVASREMDFIDDAIEQFEIALEKNQCPFEAANMLALCHKEKGQWEKAAQAFQKALQVERIPKDQILKVKYELGLIYKQQGKTEKALGLLREISSSDPKVRDAKDGLAQVTGSTRSQVKSLL